MRLLIPILFAPLLLACPGSEPEPQDETWEVVHRDLAGALLSVWGSSSTDVWAVGADALDGSGPTVGSHGECVSRPVSRPRLRDGTLDPGGRERLW